MTITLELPEAMAEKLQAEADAEGRSLESVTVERLQQSLNAPEDDFTWEGYRGATTTPEWVLKLIAEKPNAKEAWQRLVGLWKEEDEEGLMAAFREFRGK